jgi:HK97 family phage major capsid protein
MKTVKQLAEQRSALITELESLEARLETLTADEETRVNAIATELESVNTELTAANKREEAKRTIAINTNPVKDNEEGVKKAFSFARAINMGANADGLEAEMHQEGVKEMRGFGQYPSAHSIVIPSMILQQRATITENGTAGVKVQSFEEALQASSIIARVADVNLAVQDVRYIIPASPTLAWETETGALNDVGATPAAVNLVPKRLGGYMDITMQMTRQHDVDVNAKYIQILGAAVGEALDAAAFTTNSDVTAWAGATLTASSNADAGKLALTLIEKLYESKAVRGNPAFVASAGLYAELYSALQVTGVAPIVMNDRINGFPLYFSPFVADVAAQEMIFFANWQDYAVAQWGGVELLVDPYTQKGAGTNRLLLNCFFDMAQKRAASFKIGAFSGTDIS